MANLFGGNLDLGNVPLGGRGQKANPWTQYDNISGSCQRPNVVATKSAVVITEVFVGLLSQGVEIQNVRPFLVNVNGWKVFISNDSTDLDVANAQSQTLSGSLNPREIVTFNDTGWGQPITWTAGSAGWVMLTNASGVVMDFVSFNTTRSETAAMAVTISGFSDLTPGDKWQSDGISIPSTGGSLQRAGSINTNKRADWELSGTSGIGTTNSNLQLPFLDFTPRTCVTSTRLNRWGIKNFKSGQSPSLNRSTFPPLID